MVRLFKAKEIYIKLGLGNNFRKLTRQIANHSLLAIKEVNILIGKTKVNIHPFYNDRAVTIYSCLFFSIYVFDDIQQEKVSDWEDSF